MLLVSLLKKIGIPTVFLITIYLVNPYNLNIYIGYLMPALILFDKDSLVRNFDKSAFILFLFSVSYALFFALLDDSRGKQYILIYAMVPITFYMLGRVIAFKLKTSQEFIFFLLLIVGIFHSLTAMISVLVVFLQEGFFSIDRNLPNFWNGEIILATIMGSYFTLNMCIPAILVVGAKRFNLLTKIMAIIIFAISILCVLKIGSRTQLGVFLITLLISLIYIIPRQSFKNNILLFLVLVLVSFLIISKLNFNMDQDWLSAFAGRMEEGNNGDIASGGGRLIRWEKSLENLFTKPLGWDPEEFGHAHNLWLDVLRVGGIIPFLFLIIFSIMSFINIKKTIRVSKKNYAFNNLIIVYSIAFFLVFMVEPILEGMLQLFAVFCFFMGVVNSYNTSKQENALA